MIASLAQGRAKYGVKCKINGGTMSVNVTINIKNKTVDYMFYVGVEHDLEIIPGDNLEIPLLYPSADQGNQVLLSFDRCENPTEWKTFGLGEGVLRYSFDPASEQGTLSVLMGPAPAGPQETPAPTFEVSGDITGTGQDNWTEGMELILKGSNVSQITVSITE
jgi:hypothetical protein